MAQKVIVETVDDLDGSVITDGSGGTVAFSYQGKSYEIDLSSDNREKLASALEPYISKARPTGQRRRVAEAPSQSRNSGGSGNRLQEVREWARANGHQVSDRGRISKQIQDAFEQAH
ncbi:histone-like nucleoid-structuring protein Lsr2 [Naasia aerilata]|uniref:Lsr2 family protein n=1 Tax=Naasia aerilata TaxID=1162966 RepID=A0ABM8G9T0_9MICO|nr:Lsr2 family protein [Naasia aerilata]BDZ44955.1 Lsr2 family protein [Naasia aerilata]